MCPSNFCVQNGSQGRRWRSIRSGQSRRAAMHGFCSVGTDPNDGGKATEAGSGDPSVLRSGWRRVGSAEARVSPAGSRAVHQLLLPGLPTCFQPESREARFRVVISSSPQECRPTPSSLPSSTARTTSPSHSGWMDFSRLTRSPRLRGSFSGNSLARRPAAFPFSDPEPERPGLA